MIKHKAAIPFVVFFLLVVVPNRSPAQVDPNATVAGAVTLPFPTLNNIAIEWAIQGDADLDGVVAVEYRKLGDPLWKQGMPLRRIPGGQSQFNPDFSWANKHSGSLFDLEPGTSYEIRLTLTDPDGGAAVEIVATTTRAVPAPMAGAPVTSVTPATLAAALSAAQPGEILELAPGAYAGFTVTRDGLAGQPIVIRAAAPGVTVNGTVVLNNRDHVHLQGLTVNGSILFNGSDAVAILRNTVNTTGSGIVSTQRSQNSTIADNTVTGVTTWASGSVGDAGNNIGEGIQIAGPGHAILHNAVRGFRDAISFMESNQAVDQYSIDVMHNDIQVGADDGVEADYCFHNCRIMRNRITNSYMALSSQPSLGGPTYYIRNVLYNVRAAFKLHNYSVGDVLLHNTVVKNGDGFGVYTTDIFSRLYARNNLFIGGPEADFGPRTSGAGRVLYLPAADVDTTDLDHDAYGSTLGTFTGQVETVQFNNLAQLQSQTTEAHATEIGLEVFAEAIVVPLPPYPEWPVPDLRLDEDADAVDMGMVIPNINDGYQGTAPDAGAYEAGQPLPLYGPRPVDDPPPTPDTTAPTVPTNLAATALSSSQINLSWDASTDSGGSGLAGYRLYRDGSVIATLTGINYSDTGLAEGTTYSYQVLAYDGAGNGSALSPAAVATTQSDGGGGQPAASRGGGCGGGFIQGVPPSSGGAARFLLVLFWPLAVLAARRLRLRQPACASAW